jgi:hypothetical protein
MAEYLSILTNLISYSASNPENNIILEPLSCVIRIILLNYKESGTKISIQDNSITYDSPSNLQGILRNINGDTREHLHNIYNPLIKCIEWYPVSDEKNLYFYKRCIDGVNKLHETYDKESIIHHTLLHYRRILEDTISGKEIEKIDLEESPFLNELKKYWKNEEIEIMYRTLLYIEQTKDEREREIYFKNIDDIIKIKEEKVKDYIVKSSTTYN